MDVVSTSCAPSPFDPLLDDTKIRVFSCLYSRQKRNNPTRQERISAIRQLLAIQRVSTEWQRLAKSEHIWGPIAQAMQITISENAPYKEVLRILKNSAEKKSSPISAQMLYKSPQKPKRESLSLKLPVAKHGKMSALFLALKEKNLDNFTGFLASNPTYAISTGLFKAILKSSLPSFLQGLLDHPSFEFMEKYWNILQHFLITSSQVTHKKMWQVIFTHPKIKKSHEPKPFIFSKKVLEKTLAANQDELLIALLDHPSLILEEKHLWSLYNFLGSTPRGIDTQVLKAIFTHPKIVDLFVYQCTVYSDTITKSSWGSLYLCHFTLAPKGEEMFSMIVEFIRQYSSRADCSSILSANLVVAAAILVRTKIMTVEQVKAPLIERYPMVWTYVMIRTTLSLLFPKDYLPVTFLDRFNAQELNQQGNPTRLTALMTFCRGDRDTLPDYESIEKLLTLGANPNILSSKQRTALYYACKWGDFKLVKTLIEAGAHYTDGKEVKDNIYIKIAKKKGAVKIVEYLQNLLL